MKENVGTRSVKPALGQRLKEFFKETFRARGKEDYKEFFTRGFKDTGVKKARFGWMYVRVFVLLFSLFGLAAFLVMYTANGIEMPTVGLLGAVFMNFTVAVFVYELNPENNLPFAVFLLIMVLGTAAADFIILVGYYFFTPDDMWLSALWTAALEEFGKALPAIIILLFFKNRSPMLGFIVGAAVGAGLSVTEDLGYIYFSNGIYGAVDVAITRGLSAVCTHTFWTAVVGWAFCKFKKIYDPRLWLVFLSSVALHFVWDMPVDIDIAAFTVAACTIAEIAFSAVVVYKERKPYKPARTLSEVQLSIPLTENGAKSEERYRNWCSYTANVIAAITAVLVSAFVFAWAYMPSGYERHYTENKFGDESSFKEFVQDGDGSTYAVDWERPFDESGDNFTIVKFSGKVRYATQKVGEGKNFYLYYYDFEYDGETDARTETLSDIGYVTEEEDGGRQYVYLTAVKVGEGDGAQTLTVAGIRPNLSDFGYDEEKGGFYATTYYETELIAEDAVTYAGIAVLALGAVAFAVFKIKARRKKNVG